MSSYFGTVSADSFRQDDDDKRRRWFPVDEQRLGAPVKGLPIPEGFSEMMKHIGVGNTVGVMISSKPYTFSVTNDRGVTYSFGLKGVTQQ